MASLKTNTNESEFKTIQVISALESCALLDLERLHSYYSGLVKLSANGFSNLINGWICLINVSEFSNSKEFGLVVEELNFLANLKYIIESMELQNEL